MDVIWATPPIPAHNRTPAEPRCCPQRYIPSSQNFVWLIMSKGLCVARVCILIELPEVYRLNTIHPLAYVDSYPTRSHRMENPNCHHSAGMPGAAYPHRRSFTLSWKREHLCLCLVLQFSLWTDKLIFRTSGHVQPLASTTPPKRSHAHSNLQLEGPQFHSSCTCHLHFRDWHLLPINFQNLFNPTESW